MKRHSLEQLSDFGDFNRGKDLREFLAQNHSTCGLNSYLQDVRISPDGQHIHAILRKPNTGLMTFDKSQRPQLIPSQNRLDLASTTSEPVVDVVYLEQNGKDGSSAVLAVVLENGKVEFWKYCDRKSGWILQQTSELCNSPSAKVISVCVSAKCIIWCEERPPSESSPGVTRSKFRYCVCRRTYEVLGGGGVSLGGVKIALHNSPPYIVTVAGDNVYLLPDGIDTSPANVSRFFFIWSLQCDVVTIGTTCSGRLMWQDFSSSKETDFSKLICDGAGMLSIMNPPEIRAFSPTVCGGVILLLSSGWICKLSTDGTLRHIYKLPDNCLIGYEVQSSLNMYSGLLALTVARMLYLIDAACGLELEKIPLEREAVLFVNGQERETPHLLSEGGLFVVQRKECEPGHEQLGHPESLEVGSVLVEAVFEEACKYYQQRSLSSAQLTVEKLRSGGMFQAPITLSSILQDYLNGQKSRDMTPSDSCHGKLLDALEAELRSLLVLEEAKLSILTASKADVAKYCETLVHDEVRRLLCSEMDRESLLYLNAIVGTFPFESWQTVQKVLQLQYNGEGSLSSSAPPEVWKTVLSPIQAAARSPVAPANVAMPVFELLCRAVYRFQPSWLPSFLELAQQQAGRSHGVPENTESQPLYRRALAVLPRASDRHDLELELLLCSQRPHAVLQALRILMGRRDWERVSQVAQRFSQQSPLLNKEIFISLLCEVSQHRELDPYLELLWALCPEDMSATSILNTVLKSLPPADHGADPFQTHGAQLTIGLLRPLLSRVLQRDTKPSHRYADILQSPSFPPPTPPRQARGLPRSATDSGVSHLDHGQTATCVARMTSPPHHM